MKTAYSRNRIACAVILASTGGNCLGSGAAIAQADPGGLVWQAGRDFAGGYFDVHYQDGLAYAIPSPEANQLASSMTSSVAECARPWPSGLKQLILVNRDDMESMKPDAVPLYRSGAVVGNIDKLAIDGQRGWRHPTLVEAHAGQRLVAWQKALCWDQTIGVQHPRSDFPLYAGPLVMTYTPGGSQNGLWAVISSSVATYKYKIQDGDDPWHLDTASSNRSVFAPVRPLTAIEREALAAGPDVRDRIRRYVDLVVREASRAPAPSIAPPSLTPVPPEPALVKEEFEKSADFQQRREAALARWRGNVADIEQRNDAARQRHQEALAQAEQERSRIEQERAGEGYQSAARLHAQMQGLQLFLGKPYLRDLRYDADGEIMSAEVWSSRAPSFRHSVRIPVTIAVARDLKANLEKANVIPQVMLDQDLNVTDVKLITNEARVAFDYEVAGKRNSVAAYEEFLENYPAASQAGAARKAIAGLQEAERVARQEAERRRAEEAKRKEARRQAEQAAEQRAYQTQKSVGDKVCKSGSMVFGLVGVTITAFVERVDADRVQLRIASTEGQSLTYQGVPLHEGTILWDSYQEWRAC